MTSWGLTVSGTKEEAKKLIDEQFDRQRDRMDPLQVEAIKKFVDVLDGDRVSVTGNGYVSPSGTFATLQLASFKEKAGPS